MHRRERNSQETDAAAARERARAVGRPRACGMACLLNNSHLLAAADDGGGGGGGGGGGAPEGHEGVAEGLVEGRGDGAAVHDARVAHCARRAAVRPAAACGRGREREERERFGIRTGVGAEVPNAVHVLLGQVGALRFEHLSVPPRA